MFCFGWLVVFGFCFGFFFRQGGGLFWWFCDLNPGPVCTNPSSGLGELCSALSVFNTRTVVVALEHSAAPP